MTEPTPSQANELKLALRSRNEADAMLIVEQALGKRSERAVMTRLFEFRAYGDVIAHDVLLQLPRKWLTEHVWSYMEPFLDGSDSQPFREFAITLRDVGLHDDLGRLLELAREHGDHDYDIREVVEDFSPRH